MKSGACFSFLLLMLAGFNTITCKPLRTGEDLLRTRTFDEDWRFLKGNPTGAENPAFDDSRWRSIDLPHDWSIEDLPGSQPEQPDPVNDSIIGPFSKASVGKMSTGYTIGGTAWYRKTFTIHKADENKVAYLQFDGIYMNADVWINGKHVGSHPYGYTSFHYDITPFLNPAGQPNLVAVRVKNEGRNSRWYSGSGIYRHTWLTLVEPVHIATWGMYISTPVITDRSAEVEITTSLVNGGKEAVPVSLLVEIINPEGSVVAKAEENISLLPVASQDVKQRIALANPVLWSVEHPNLYQARTTVREGSKVSDQLTTNFGIRQIRIDAVNGFTLNGQALELRGGCFHHDNGPLGAAAIDRAEERKIELLKKAGFNAIRCSHNPPSPYLLDVCDRLGMLVIDEAFDMWTRPKSPEDYANSFADHWKEDLTAMVRRDRNHPSVILWSIGNEIPESGDTSGFRIASAMVAEVRKLDPSRGVTEALVDFAGIMGGKSNWDERAPHIALFDAAGYNYGYTKYEQDHQKFPERVIYASESMPPFAFENWQKVEQLPYVFGDFTWTAMDYLGEAGVGMPRLLDTHDLSSTARGNIMGLFFNPDSWPVFINFQGDLDLIGNPKNAYYYRHVVWRDSKVEMLVHRPIPAGKTEVTSPWGFPDELKCWNWEGHEGEKLQVHVYTRSELVKLELNGRVVAEKTVDDSKSIKATFEVAYEPGTLTARCFDKDMETASESIKTVGKPAAIRLNADRTTIQANRNDLSYVMAEIVDAEGNVVPNADDVLVNFTISGNGEIAGAGSGIPTDMSSFQQPRKKTWQGRCLAIVRPKGEAGTIVLTAMAEELKEARVEIVTE